MQLKSKVKSFAESKIREAAFLQVRILTAHDWKSIFFDKCTLISTGLAWNEHDSK